MDNGHLTAGEHCIAVSREARMVAFLALKKMGKAKGSTLETTVAVKRAILDGCDVDPETGLIAWKAGTLAFREASHVKYVKRALDRLLDDESGEGVDVDLAEGALELQEALSHAAQPRALVAAAQR